ncbi:MAG: hypothetical protein JHD33_01590 [Chthoniobacterales bacterium]|nr:hypothetical protein [Chthoniobacterales bacterium]
MPISSSWLWLAAGLYLLFEIFRGWRRGVVRHGVSVFALLTAGGIGWIFAWMTGFIADRVIPLPAPIGRAIFGLAAGVAFYLAAVVLSSLLFKKTSQQSAGLVRLVYGIGGAFFGLIFGLLVLWGGVTIFRTLGAVAQGKEELAAQGAVATTAADSGLVAVKASLEQGAAGGFIDKVDILPASFYGALTKLVQVTGSPGAAARLFSYPPLQELLAQPKIAAVFTEPAVAKAAAEGNYFALLSSPQLSAAASDPEVQKSFTGFDWQKALDYALQESAPSPVPSP